MIDLIKAHAAARDQLRSGNSQATSDVITTRNTLLDYLLDHLNELVEAKRLQQQMIEAAADGDAVEFENAALEYVHWLVEHNGAV